MTWRDDELYAKDHNLSKLHLGKALFRGDLALMVGAGISNSLGLPRWSDLVKKCLAETGLPHDDIDEKTEIARLQRAVGEVRGKIGDDTKFNELVRKTLYAGTKERNSANITPLLTALGALMMGSRRGRIKEVWTLNFDDVFEWYLRMNGFLTQTVTNVPCLLHDVDVTVFHPHGFLPLDPCNGKSSEKIVFDDTSYAEFSCNKEYQDWKHASQNVVSSKVILSVGLGWSSDSFQTMIRAASSNIISRPVAFWFFGPAGTADQIKNRESDKANCLKHHVVPLEFASYDDFAPFLLGICEEAMKNLPF
jgi:hypothetical protein